MEPTFANIDHRGGSMSGAVSGAVSGSVDLRPMIVAVRELTAAIKSPDHLLQPQEPFIVTADAPIVHVNVPAQETAQVEVNLPEMQPVINVAMPEIPAPQVTVIMPYWPIICVGLLNTITLITGILLVYFKG